jgi:hypothetical protein
LGYWDGRLLVGSYNPTLFNHELIAEAPEIFIFGALELTNDNPKIFQQVLGKLLNSPLRDIAKDLVNTHFSELVSALFNSVKQQQQNDGKRQIDDVWLTAVGRHPDRFVKEILPSVNSLSDLCLVFEILNWPVNVLNEVPVDEWAKLVQRSNLDIESDQHWAIVLMIFFQSLREARPGLEPVFEALLPIILNGLQHGYAPDFVKSYVAVNARTYWTTSNWDLCERLLREVEDIYKYRKLGEESWHRISSGLS